MKLFLDSLWRAAAYCLLPRVIALSLAPLLLMAGGAFFLGYLYWDSALDWVRDGLGSSSVANGAWGWLQSAGVGDLKTVVAPLIVIFSVTPLLVLACLLAVAALMTPALTRLVVDRRFALLERKRGGSFFLSVVWSLGSCATAMVAMVVTVPLWLIPPLIFVLPPLIWGWLTYRVMTFDVLAEHASKDERRAIFKKYRISLMAIGVMCGYLGAAPSLVWASGALFAAAFVILLPVAIWMYTFVFAFSSLWFAHFALAALEQVRADSASNTGQVAPHQYLPAHDDSPSNPASH